MGKCQGSKVFLVLPTHAQRSFAQSLFEIRPVVLWKDSQIGKIRGLTGQLSNRDSTLTSYQKIAYLHKSPIIELIKIKTFATTINVLHIERVD